MVPLGDYGRVLAEFWADGPASETPPGHWFTLLNEVNENPDLVKKFEGSGNVLPDLEWDVKSYFTLGGAVHDAAVASWGVKGYYDYIRPISAIRYMADQGQSTDPNLPNYDPHGIPLVDNFIEVVESGDPLAGDNNENVGKIKLYAWKGYNELDQPNVDVAGTGWMLAENWFPYQKISFVTPPFAGYVSGHSTFSRAAAEVLSLFTGDPFFPGGMGTFSFDANTALEFEDGPSVDVELQWATYKDASDQCSLSRIWGGIHPPTDDIPGRKMGVEIGTDAFDLAKAYFEGNLSTNNHLADALDVKVYPNPSDQWVHLKFNNTQHVKQVEIFTINAQKVMSQKIQPTVLHRFDVSTLPNGVYLIKVSDEQSRQGTTKKLIISH